MTNRRIRAILALLCLLVSTVIVVGCSAPRPTPTPDVASTVVARVMATLEVRETAAAATWEARVATITPTPPPSATPTPEPTSIPGPTMTPPPEIEPEEYAVYAALIEANPVGSSLGEPIMIRGQTMSGVESLDHALEYAETRPSPRLLESYRSRNLESYPINPNLDTELAYDLMPESEFSELFQPKLWDWKQFWERYPEAEGIVIYSRVGLAEDEALVRMDYRCGGLCGAGGLYVLSRESGEWIVTGSLMEWMS